MRIIFYISFIFLLTSSVKNKNNSNDLFNNYLKNINKQNIEHYLFVDNTDDITFDITDDITEEFDNDFDFCFIDKVYQRSTIDNFVLNIDNYQVVNNLNTSCYIFLLIDLPPPLII